MDVYNLGFVYLYSFQFRRQLQFTQSFWLVDVILGAPQYTNQHPATQSDSRGYRRLLNASLQDSGESWECNTDLIQQCWVCLYLGQLQNTSLPWSKTTKWESEMLGKARLRLYGGINMCSFCWDFMKRLSLNLSIDIFCQLTLLQERFAYLQPQLCACAARGVTLSTSQV